MDTEKILLMQEARRLCLAGNGAGDTSLDSSSFYCHSYQPQNLQNLPAKAGTPQPSPCMALQDATCDLPCCFILPEAINPPKNVPKSRAASIAEQKFKSMPYWDEINPTLGFKSIPGLGLICRMKDIKWHEPLQCPWGALELD